MIRKLIKLSLALELGIPTSSVKDVKEVGKDRYEVTMVDGIRISVTYIGDKISRAYNINWKP